MQADPRITLFTKILQGDTTSTNFFNNPSLCLVVPSDTAMNFVDIAKMDISVVQRHVFISPSKCLVSTWSSYDEIKTKTESVYRIAAYNSFLFFSNLTGSPLVNGAKVIYQDIDNTLNNQVYHIIDRVLLEGSISDFLPYLQTDSSLSISYSYWNSLVTLYRNGSLNGISKFKDSFITFTQAVSGTVLVPSNDAWNTLSNTDRNSLSNNMQLCNVMARFYIPYRMIFVHDATISFMAGFTDNPMLDGSGNIGGQYYRDSYGDNVNVQGYFANIGRSNVVMQYGVIHVINSPMVLLDTRQNFLQRNFPAFYKEVQKDNFLMSLLAGNNTVLAADNHTMDIINQMDAATKNLSLSNCFIMGNVFLVNSNLSVYLTAANVSVRVFIVDTNIYLDSVASFSERTYFDRASVIKADNVVDGININVIRGTIGVTIKACSYILQKLERSAYNQLVNTLGITLGLGSPYTLFVPNNNNLNAYSNSTTQNPSSYYTTPYIPLVFTTASSTVMNISTVMNSGSGGSTSGSGSSASGSNNVNSQSNIQYLLQRMIIANNLVLGLRSLGKFKAATMNYAAANEMVDIEIMSDSSVSFGIDGVKEIKPSVDGGFYCYSNDSPLPNRRNLIYPVNFLLISPKDSSRNICVKAPCSGCLIKYLRSLVLTLAILVYMFY